MSVLDTLLLSARERADALHARRGEFERTIEGAPRCRGFRDALVRDHEHLAVIAEFKRRSPSKGPLNMDAKVERTVPAYLAGGASALSVLTEPTQFGGSLADLEAARNISNVPILRKDFIVDDVQILESRAYGADAILLIAAAYPDQSLCADRAAVAREFGLDVLVEVHDENEARRVAGMDGVVFGVNARNLSTFDEHLDAAFALRSHFAPEHVVVAESAIRTQEDAQRAFDHGFSAVLVGEMLMRSGDPADTVRALAAVSTAPRISQGRG